MPGRHDARQDITTSEEQVFNITVDLKSDPGLEEAIRTEVMDNFPAVARSLGTANDKLVIRWVPLQFRDLLLAKIQQLLIAHNVEEEPKTQEDKEKPTPEEKPMTPPKASLDKQASKVMQFVKSLLETIKELKTTKVDWSFLDSELNGPKARSLGLSRKNFEEIVKGLEQSNIKVDLSGAPQSVMGSNKFKLLAAQLLNEK